MLQNLWKRQYKVRFPDLGFSFDNTGDAEGLKVEFRVEKDLTQETNKCQVKFTNLSNATRAKIETADTKVELFAGYRDNGGPVKMFVGTVIEAETKDSGQEVETELTLADGKVNLRDSVCSLSFPPGTSGKTIIEAAASVMGLPIVYGENVDIGAYTDGFSHIGNAGYAMSSVCRAFGCDWSVQNGVLQVILAGGTSTNRGLVFSPASGLLGSPERIIRAKPKEDKPTPKKRRTQKAKKVKPEKKAGWKITTLLFPTVNPGDAVKVESRLITGWFRVETANHEGDSAGGQWQSTFELIEGLG